MGPNGRDKGVTDHWQFADSAQNTRRFSMCPNDSMYKITVPNMTSREELKDSPKCKKRRLDTILGVVTTNSSASKGGHCNISKPEPEAAISMATASVVTDKETQGLLNNAPNLKLRRLKAFKLDQQREALGRPSKGQARWASGILSDMAVERPWPDAVQHPQVLSGSCTADHYRRTNECTSQMAEPHYRERQIELTMVEDSLVEVRGVCGAPAMTRGTPPPLHVTPLDSSIHSEYHLSPGTGAPITVTSSGHWLQGVPEPWLDWSKSQNDEDVDKCSDSIRSLTHGVAGFQSGVEGMGNNNNNNHEDSSGLPLDLSVSYVREHPSPRSEMSTTAMPGDSAGVCAETLSTVRIVPEKQALGIACNERPQAYINVCPIVANDHSYFSAAPGSVTLPTTPSKQGQLSERQAEASASISSTISTDKPSAWEKGKSDPSAVKNTLKNHLKRKLTTPPTTSSVHQNAHVGSLQLQQAPSSYLETGKEAEMTDTVRISKGKVCGSGEYNINHPDHRASIRINGTPIKSELEPKDVFLPNGRARSLSVNHRHLDRKQRRGLAAEIRKVKSEDKGEPWEWNHSEQHSRREKRSDGQAVPSAHENNGKYAGDTSTVAKATVVHSEERPTSCLTAMPNVSGDRPADVVCCHPQGVRSADTPHSRLNGLLGATPSLRTTEDDEPNEVGSVPETTSESPGTNCTLEGEGANNPSFFIPTRADGYPMLADDGSVLLCTTLEGPTGEQIIVPASQYTPVVIVGDLNTTEYQTQTAEAPLQRLSPCAIEGNKDNKLIPSPVNHQQLATSGSADDPEGTNAKDDGPVAHPELNAREQAADERCPSHSSCVAQQSTGPRRPLLHRVPPMRRDDSIELDVLETHESLSLAKSGRGLHKGLPEQSQSSAASLQRASDRTLIRERVSKNISRKQQKRRSQEKLNGTTPKTGHPTSSTIPVVPDYTCHSSGSSSSLGTFTSGSSDDSEDSHGLHCSGQSLETDRTGQNATICTRGHRRRHANAKGPRPVGVKVKEERIKDVGYRPCVTTDTEGRKGILTDASSQVSQNKENKSQKEGSIDYKAKTKELEEKVHRLERELSQMKHKLQSSSSEDDHSKKSSDEEEEGEVGSTEKKWTAQEEHNSAYYRNIADMRRLKEERISTEEAEGAVKYVEKGNISRRKEDPMMELVEDCGVYIKHSALAKCRLKCKNSGTMLTRFLLEEFFEQDQLASSSAAGRGHAKRPSLDPIIISALIAFVRRECPRVTEAELMQAINQKCTDVRKKQRKQARQS